MAEGGRRDEQIGESLGDSHFEMPPTVKKRRRECQRHTEHEGRIDSAEAGDDETDGSSTMGVTRKVFVGISIAKARNSLAICRRGAQRRDAISGRDSASLLSPRPWRSVVAIPGYFSVTRLALPRRSVGAFVDESGGVSGADVN